MEIEGGQNDALMAEGGTPSWGSDDSSERSRTSEGVAVANNDQGGPTERGQGRLTRLLAQDGRLYQEMQH